MILLEPACSRVEGCPSLQSASLSTLSKIKKSWSNVLPVQCSIAPDTSNFKLNDILDRLVGWQWLGSSGSFQEVLEAPWLGGKESLSASFGGPSALRQEWPSESAHRLHMCDMQLSCRAAAVFPRTKQSKGLDWRHVVLAVPIDSSSFVPPVNVTDTHVYTVAIRCRAQRWSCSDGSREPELFHGQLQCEPF